MAPLTTNIATMVPSKSRYQIIARATRMWNVTPKANDIPVSLDVIFLDAQGDHIQATINRKWMHSFKELLQEGQVYKLTHFDVEKNKRGYRPVNTNENIIKFTPFTSVLESPQNEKHIPMYKFEFHPLHLLEERSNETDYLIDVVGLLTGIEDKAHVMTTNGPTEIRHIFIEDERDNKIRVTLWGKATKYVDGIFTTESGKPNTIIITSTRVVLYNDEYQLQSTHGTKVYIDMDIPETRELLERVTSPKSVEHLQNTIQQQIEDTMTANRKPIKELKEMEITDMKATYTCHGQIVDIRTDIEWRYISCPTCRKGLGTDNYCHKCRQQIQYPTQRYRIIGTLSDGDSEASIVVFDKEAEKIIGQPIDKLLDIYEKDDGKQRVYNILQSCIGKFFTFKVAIGTNNYGQDRELKVLRTYIANNILEENQASGGGPKETTSKEIEQAQMEHPPHNEDRSKSNGGKRPRSPTPIKTPAKKRENRHTDS